MRACTALLLTFALLLGLPAASFAKNKKEKRHRFSLALDDEDDTRLGFVAKGGRMLFSGGYSLESFNRFRNSYNLANTNLSSPMGRLSINGGWAWGGGLRGSGKLSAMGISIMRYNTEATASATLRNGNSRQIRMVMKPVDLDFDLLMGIGRRVKLGMATGYEAQNVTLYSGYQYKNGFLSYGSDQPLNGIFNSRDGGSITLGLRAEVSIVRQARLSVRADYVGVFAGKQKEGGDYELLPWRDEMYGASGSGGIHTDGFNHFYLPEDVTNANNDYVYYVGQGSNFAKGFRGWRFNVGLDIDLLSWKVN